MPRSDSRQELPRAGFAQMREATPADWALIGAEFLRFGARLPDRVLAHLHLLSGDFGGFPVDRLTHSLQAATRAMRDGRGEDYVVMALLHDIGDTLCTFNHPEMGAAILQPFVSERLHWICQQHGMFQGYYYFHMIGADRDLREQWRGHPGFADCAEFCELYDQNAFDPAYDTAPLACFEPMLRRVLAQPVHGVLAQVVHDQPAALEFGD